MGNTTATNPNVIDTFTADVHIGGTEGGLVTVTSVVIKTATAGDTAVFIDKNAVEVLRLANNISTGSMVWTPAEPFTFQNGMTWDDSASGAGWAAGDFIFVYLK